jgi:hypothetical protein
MSMTNRRAVGAAVLAGFTLFLAGCGGGGATSGSRLASTNVGNTQTPPTPIPEATPGTTPTSERTEVTVICPMPVIEK